MIKKPIDHSRISAFTIPIMQTFAFLLVLAAFYSLIDLGLDEVFRYWRVVGINLFYE